MEFDPSALEDGEIPDDDYSPLERPANYAPPFQRFPVKVESESEEELLTTSGSDSDSDTQTFQAKRPKVKLKARLHNPTNSRKKKYDIWSARVHEDVLSETLNSCNVTQRDMSRNVESYDYRLSYSYLNKDTVDGDAGKRDETCDKTHYSDKSGSKKDFLDDCKEMGRPERANNKRTHHDRKDRNLRLKKRPEEKRGRGSSRHLLDLNQNNDCTVEEFAVDVSNKLCEKKEDLIEKVVKVLGMEKIRKIFTEVQRIEADGGMMVMNQMRRRTPGGVFLFLVRHDNGITKEQCDLIFEEDRKDYKVFLREKKKKRTSEMKAKIAASRSKLPELLTKAELVQKLSKDSWSLKGSDQEDVTNPPPTPETDGPADSGDGECPDEQPPDPRRIGSYGDDFLDLSAGNEMDLF